MLDIGFKVCFDESGGPFCLNLPLCHPTPTDSPPFQIRTFTLCHCNGGAVSFLLYRTSWLRVCPRGDFELDFWAMLEPLKPWGSWTECIRCHNLDRSLGEGGASSNVLVWVWRALKGSRRFDPQLLGLLCAVLKTLKGEAYLEEIGHWERVLGGQYLIQGHLSHFLSASYDPWIK